MEVSFKCFGLLAGNLEDIIRVRSLVFVQSVSLHALHTGGIPDLPVGKTTLAHVFGVVMEPKLNVLNLGSVVLGKEIGNFRVFGGSRTRKVVHLITVGLLVEENNDGGVGNVIGGDVVDSHTIRGGNVFVLFTQQFTLIQKRSGHQMRRTEDGVGDTRITLGLFQNVVTSSVERNKRDIVTVQTGHFGNTLEGMGRTKERDLHKVLNLLFLGCFQKGGEDIGPSLDVRQGTEDSLASVQSNSVVYKASQQRNSGIEDHVFP